MRFFNRRASHSIQPRALFEPRFDRSFSDVRVHSDANAGASARAVNALAYTVGSDIVFAHGQFAPGSADGQKFLIPTLLAQGDSAPFTVVLNWQAGLKK